MSQMWMPSGFVSKKKDSSQIALAMLHGENAIST